MEVIDAILPFLLAPFVPESSRDAICFDSSLRPVFGTCDVLRRRSLLFLASSIKEALLHKATVARASLRITTLFMLNRDAAYSDDAAESLHLRAQRALSMQPMMTSGAFFPKLENAESLYRDFRLVGLPISVLPENQFGSVFRRCRTEGVKTLPTPPTRVHQEVLCLDSIKMQNLSATSTSTLHPAKLVEQLLPQNTSQHICEQLATNTLFSEAHHKSPSPYGRAIEHLRKHEPLLLDRALVLGGYATHVCDCCLCPLGANGHHDHVACKQVQTAAKAYSAAKKVQKRKRYMQEIDDELDALERRMIMRQLKQVGLTLRLA